VSYVIVSGWGDKTLEHKHEKDIWDNVPDIKSVNELPGITGEELFRRYLLGDDYAFEDLVALYEADLSRFVNSKINDYYETKYLTIEAFGQLAVSGKKFAGQSTLKTYLFTIARNLVSKHLKERNKIINEHISFDEILYDVSDGSLTPDEYMEAEENKHQLHEAMKGLKQEYYRTLRLLYFEDMSYRDAGKILGKSEKQIKDLAYRAKASLKKKLKNQAVV